MSHLHSVIDEDVAFVIDPATRIVSPRSTDCLKLVQGDHNSEVYTFHLPRYIEGHDMSSCNRVEVHFLNLGNGQQNPGVFRVSDFGLNEDETEVYARWVISGEATKYAGSLCFIVSFKCIPDDVVEYAWNTEKYKGVTVGEGIDNGEAIMEKYSDVLAEWEQRVFENTLPTDGTPGQVLTKTENGTEWKDAPGGADWNAAEGEPGHVLNRTHYEEDAFEPIYWDGDTTGRTVLDLAVLGYTGGERLVKVSDEVLSIEQLVGAKYHNTVDEPDVYDTVEMDELNLEMPGVLSHNGSKIAIVYDSDSVSTALGVPNGTITNGVYFRIKQNGHHISHLVPPKITHKLDPKYLPEGIGYSEYETGTVLAETSPVFDEDMGAFILTDPISVTTGEECTVKWNGTEYTCVCGEVDLGGMIGQYLGNTSVMGGDDTGEPFLVVVIPPEVAAEEGVTAQIMPLDGSTELTISITGTVETVIPIPAKYLPGAVILYTDFTYLYKTPDTTDANNLLIKTELASLMESGRIIYVRGEENGEVVYSKPVLVAIRSTGGIISVINTTNSITRKELAAPNTRDV